MMNLSQYDKQKSLCTYWCSNVYTADFSKACNLYASSTNGITHNSMLSRACGFSVRPVSD